MEGSRTALREDEGFADFFDVLRVGIVLNVVDYTLLHQGEEVLGTET
jgi:hypothetical protein